MLLGKEQSDQLSRWPKRRIKIEATVSRTGDHYDYASRANVPSVLLINVEIREGDDTEVIGRVWCSWAAMLIKAGVQAGDVVRCTVQTYQFDKRDKDDPNKTAKAWAIREPRDVQCLNRKLDPPDQRITVAIPKLPLPSVNGNGSVNGRTAVAAAPTGQPEQPSPVPTQPVPVPPVPPPPQPEPQPVADPKREVFDQLDRLVEKHGLPFVEKVLVAVKALRE